MSIIFGICKPHVDPDMKGRLARMAVGTARYAPDGTSLTVSGRVGMGFQAYYTDARSQMEQGPVIDSAGNMIVFDGRLDNIDELCDELDLDVSSLASSSIVLVAFERWGESCFSHLVGDWSLVLWSCKDEALYLARDHAGVRNLFYEFLDNTVTWGSCLETFFADGKRRELDPEYAFRYLSAEPTRGWTPYARIQSVTPASYLRIHGSAIVRKSHWSSKTRDQIHYRRDDEYAEHFSELFERAVIRRSGRGAPILAELSGGMDSSSIVCISDRARIKDGASSADLLDTVSYYDDSESDWNERPFFEAVERQRAKVGLHLDVSRSIEIYAPPDPCYLQPGIDVSGTEAERIFEKAIEPGRYRVVLSGVGGDELLGGPPNPLPELADYLFRGTFKALFLQAFSWSLANRSTLISTLAHTVYFGSRLYWNPSRKPNHPPTWITNPRRTFARTFEPDDFRGTFFGYLPSAIDNCITWWNMLETLPHRFQLALQRREYRYPFLDRDLVDYLLRVPRSRLLKPGRRRFLMRLALTGIVPNEILERRRKAFVSRSPLLRFNVHRHKMTSVFESSELNKAGLIDDAKLRKFIAEANSDETVKNLTFALRAIRLELWLRTNSGRRLHSNLCRGQSGQQALRGKR